MICEFDGCEEPVKKHRKLCPGHFGQRSRHQPLRPLHTSYGRNPQSVVRYSTAHWRIRKSKGSANDHSCVDCGGAAEQWSLMHIAQDVLTEVGGQSDGKTYSLNIDDYEPRCRPCHTLFDLMGV